MAARALLAVAMAAAVLGTALGASYTVGAPGGSWDLQTNYVQWVSNINFQVGDQLVFKYSSAQHNVVEVSKADYDSCSSSSPLGAVLQTGDDTIQLAAAGTRYFICGVPGHCTGGMKVAVKVEAAATGNNPPPPSPPTPSRPSSPPPSRPSSPPPATAPAGAMPPPAGGTNSSPTSSAIKSTGAESLVGLSLGAIVAGLMIVFY